MGLLELSLQQPEGRHRSLLTRRRVERWLGLALNQPAQITVRVVAEAEGRRLNREYRGKDYATNVLTFSYGDEPVTADIVLCAAVVEKEADEQGVNLVDHYAHLMIHAALHALGYDHARAAQAREMQALEAALLAHLSIADPYRRRPRLPAAGRRRT